jgi:hypothetical protein
MATKTWISTSSTSFSTAGNWSGGVAPANSDTLVFNGQSAISCASDLSTVLTGVTLVVEKSYTGSIGVCSATTQTYLVLDGGTAYIGQDTGASTTGTGPTLCMVNFGSTAAVATVYDSGQTGALSGTLPVVFLKGTSLTLNQYGGNVGVAPLAGETSTLTACKLAEGDAPTVPAKLYMGRGVTTTLLTAAYGTIVNRAEQTQTTVTLSGRADYTYDGTGAHTTLTISDGAYCTYSGTGTITTLNVNGGGTFDRTKDTRALTITTVNVERESTILLDNGVSGSTTRTNAIVLDGTGSGGFRSSTPAGERL